MVYRSEEFLSESLQPPFEPIALLRNARKLARQMRAASDLKPIRVAILGGATSQEIAAFLDLFLLEKGFSPLFWHSEYGKYWEDAVLHTTQVAEFQPDLVYVHTGIRNVQSWPSIGAGEAEVLAHVDREIERFTQIWQSLNAKVSCTILQNNFEFPDVRILGNLEAQNVAGSIRYVTQLNARLAAEARDRSYLLINDIHYLAAQVGLDKWHDPSRWFSYKLPTSPDGSVASAFSLASLIAARYGLGKKVLVLDLDNTIWGGVIGDDGVDRISIGNETAQAEAYTAFQKYCLALKNRGVVLAVCSKNNEAVALSGFEHPDSILKLTDIACFKANWEPKHENLKAIAHELNLGLDSFVFVDDNPAERALVSAQLPVVAVPNVGSDVSEYARIIDHHRFFEPLAISAEDLKRGDQYQANAERAKSQSVFATYDEYLKSLEMVAEVGPFTPTYLDRITQLTNKTNQFNLTTRRYSFAEISRIANDPNHVTLYVRLSDKFGDHGLISVVIGRREEDTLYVELWLMSCRVLKRDVELLVLDELVHAARALGLTYIHGLFLRTPKNSMVADHYQTLGFASLDAGPERSEWLLNISQYQERNRNITLNESTRSSRQTATSVS